jgi:hypothetical protein
MTQIIAVSKAGTNVLTNTDPNGFNYSSDYNTLKYYAAGSIQLIGSAAFPSTNRFFGTVTHNLNYFPYYGVFVNPSASPTRFYPNSFIQVGAGVVEYATAFAGTADLRLMYEITNTSGGTVFGTVTFYYKLFRNNVGL